MTDDVLTEALALAAHLDTPRVLEEFVASAARHTGARYAAMAVLDSWGETTVFVHKGMSAETVAKLGRPPRGVGVLAAIPADGALVLDDLASAPEFLGLPPGHPPMRNFLGVPVRSGDTVLGRLYLAEKLGGFDVGDVSTVRLLAAAAGIALENARLYAEARDRERWLAVSQDILSELLSGTDEEEVLELVAAQVREVAEADAAVIVLPSLDGAWVIEIAAGEGSAPLVGAVVPAEGLAMQVLRSGAGCLVESIARSEDTFVPAIRRYERALYAPMHAPDGADKTAVGVLIVLREASGVPFTPGDLAIAEVVAAQAALALRLAAARHSEDVAALLNERARIARDLHDLAIQQLFATGMRLERAAKAAEAAPAAQREEGGGAALHSLIEEAIGEVEESIRQIRGIVRSLRDRDEQLPMLDRLVQEASIARGTLGFAPSVLVTIDGATLDGAALEAEDLHGDLATDVEARLGVELADDLIAVVREGLSNAARHARPKSVQVEVDVTSDEVLVKVVDDGVGPDPATDRRSGLDNLSTRALGHNGESTLRPGIAGGAVLTWRAHLS